MKIETIGAEILRVASEFTGQYEIVANSDWQDKAKSTHLNRLMKSVGWQRGWPYCAAFAEACWVTAYQNLKAPPELITEIKTKLNPSSVESRRNFQSHITRSPVPGAIFFMQKGSTGLGHEGLVVSATETTFSTIEGNTSPQVTTDSAKDREGDGIFAKTRNINYTPTSKLFLVGFVNPLVWD